LEDFEDLINLGVAHEEGTFLDQLSENAPDGPHVNPKRVLLLAQKDFWRSVPESLDLVGQGLDWDGEGSGQAKVTDLDIALIGHKEVLGL